MELNVFAVQHSMFSNYYEHLFICLLKKNEISYYMMFLFALKSVKENDATAKRIFTCSVTQKHVRTHFSTLMILSPLKVQ